MSKLRLGVDVGGTFTKAVAIQTQPYALIAQALVPTTHDAPEGVARGIVQVLTEVLAHPDIDVERVSLVAHSTTQAINALLEGDAAVVGIIGMGRGRDAMDAARRTRIGDIPLAPGKHLSTQHTFLDTSAGLSAEVATRAIAGLVASGAQAIAVSEAFSVDDPANEICVLDAAAALGVPAVAGHHLSAVYGLEIRTLTAAINASLLPKMLQTAELVDRSLRDAAITAPLMVMRGDGGLTDLATLRRRPILTLLSGPAASLAGALLSGGVADGVFLEVGGTSSNLGVVRGGQPELSYVQVMDHPTCVRSLDVRVQGIAGGSLARLRGRRISDIGPRSAHIAGLPYASLCPEITHVTDLKVVCIAPQPGDPHDYAVVRSGDGQSWALTVTCAATALGLVPKDAYAYGSRDAALHAFAALGAWLNCSAHDAAQQLLDLAAQRIANSITTLAKEYKLPRRNYELIGGGGGAGALLPAVAARMGLSYRIVAYAEVISSLGDALASVRTEIERALSSTVDTAVLMHDAERAAIEAGAAPESVQVVIERDEQRGTVRAVATGSVALAAPVAAAEIEEFVARDLAVRSISAAPAALRLVADTGGFWVYQTGARWWRRPRSVVVDRRGVVRLNLVGADVVCGSPEALRAALPAALRVSNVLGMPPIVRLLVGNRLVDLVGEAAGGVLATAETTLARADLGATVVAIVQR